MARKVILTFFMVIVMAVSVLPTAQANLLVCNGDPEMGYGYGNIDWTNMTTALNNACRNIATTPNFENLTQMLSYNAIWLDLRQLSVNSLLSATELSNIAAFMATGRKVVLMGENNSWTLWDNQILGLVGSSLDNEFNGTVNAIVANALTAGVSTIDLVFGGTAVGGTALFDQNFATLWGSNVLTVLDVNVFDDVYWNNNDNSIFAQNVAQWICPVPLPGTFWLLGLGLTGLWAGRKKLMK